MSRLRFLSTTRMASEMLLAMSSNRIVTNDRMIKINQI